MGFLVPVSLPPVSSLPLSDDFEPVLVVDFVEPDLPEPPISQTENSV